MRHLYHHRKFNRTCDHRRAMRRNLAQNLFEHGEITTTLPKAKDMRPFCEKLITLAVKVRRHTAAKESAEALSARRRIHQLLGERSLIPKEHVDAFHAMSDAARAKTLRSPSGRRHRTGEPQGRLSFTGESISHRLIEKIAPRYEDRPGGYTRVVRLARRRLGDASPLAVLQLVGQEESPGVLTKPGKTARRRRTDARYSFAVQVAKGQSARGRGASATGASSEASVGDST